MIHSHGKRSLVMWVFPTEFATLTDKTSCPFAPNHFLLAELLIFMASPGLVRFLGKWELGHG